SENPKKQCLKPSLLKYVLDSHRPSAELIVKDGNICLTREDFWSLGLNRCMDSNIGNACFKIVQEEAQRHGKDIHIVDMYVVPTWKTKNVDPLVGLPDNLGLKDAILFPAWSRQQDQVDHYLLCVEFEFLTYNYNIFYFIILTNHSTVNHDFPPKTSGNYCGILMLMVSVCFSQTFSSFKISFKV
uniref:Uncharacterized protein n=1 Tax=Erpetoichthys calabaricus TaxID=27687 RepID=A0A8C4X2H9_ERPCA